MSKLIVVCGLPGTGKTTLAKELSKKLNIVNLNKDSIKENLYEIEDLSTLEDSRKLGIRSYQLQIRLAEEQILNNIDLIIESPFMHEQDKGLFQNWLDKYDLSLHTIICQIDEPERIQRFTTRPRHQAHHDHERNAAEINRPDDFYKNMPGKQIWITTNKPVNKLIEQIIEKINS